MLCFCCLVSVVVNSVVMVCMVLDIGCSFVSIVMLLLLYVLFWCLFVCLDCALLYELKCLPVECV